jgi:glycosyltransferase involved in cell wall biosynthesis
MDNISVIIRVKDDTRIFKLLDSLKGQPYKEIIVVQNGTKQLWEELSKYCKDSGIIFTYFPEGNSSKAYNRGAELATGEILLLCDSDVYLPPNFIEKVPEVVKNKWLVSGAWAISDFGERDICWNQCLIMMKSDYLAVKHDEDFAKPHATDVSFSLKAKTMGYRCMFTDKLHYFHPLAGKRGYYIGKAEARAAMTYPGYLKIHRMLGSDFIEILRIVRHSLGLIRGSL